MMSALYIGSTGLTTHSQGMNILSNNLANTNTIGYKQQSALFQDLISESLLQGSSVENAFNQKGLGSRLADVRTNFNQGAYEPGNNITDLALSGKGFFQVTNEGLEHYTRAGNFRFDVEGYLKDPNGFVLSGIPMVEGEPVGVPEPIKLDFADPAVAFNASKFTTELAATFNISEKADHSVNATDPYFALASSWEGTKHPPLASNKYSYSQPMRIYDAEGTAQDVNIFFDSAPGSGGNKVFEYVVAIDPSLDGSAFKGTESAGLLMSGTLTFSSNGEIIDMTAFTPTSADPKDLTSWKMTPLVDGVPQIAPQFLNKEGTASLAPQTISLNLGIKSKNSVWENEVASANDIKTDFATLPSMGEAAREGMGTTSYSSASRTYGFKQDGYGIGDLQNIFIDPDGTIRGIYSNSVEVDLYSIPVYRVTSEDNLRREGMNHFSAPPEAGEIEYGVAGTENYATILADSLETSNVDMSVEMVNMMIMQRGFQSNSKTITTADEMLQKAMEVKRN